MASQAINEQQQVIPRFPTPPHQHQSPKSLISTMMAASLTHTRDTPTGNTDGVAATHTFDDGTSYTGTWLLGRPHGRGTFTWPTGETFAGEWSAGLQHGVGAFRGPDGSTYVGFWQHGQQHGEGVYKPSGPQRAEVVFIQAYRAGTLLREQVLRVDDLDVPRRQESKRGAKQFGVDALPIDNQAPVSPTDASGSAREASGSTGPQQQGSLSTQPTGTITPHAVAGTVVIKGHRSYELIRQLQLGLLFSVAQASAAALDTHPATTTINNNSSTPCLPPEAFTQQLTQYFPATSDMSYPFRWKDYAPMAFTHLRAVFGIDSTEYLLSLAGQGALREMPSPGKSGSTFFLSQDDRFLIKTVTREEMRMLLRLVPEYYQHVAGHASTLLTRFYGVHRVQHLNGSSTRFVVMGNVFPSDVRLQRKYDLKGSWYKRTVGALKRTTNPNAILKDCDLDIRLLLDDDTHAQLDAALRADCDMLRSLAVIDYSLLMGVHYVAWGNDHWQPPEPPSNEPPLALLASKHPPQPPTTSPSKPPSPLAPPRPRIPRHSRSFLQRINCFSPRLANTKSVYRADTFQPTASEADSTEHPLDAVEMVGSKPHSGAGGDGIGGVVAGGGNGVAVAGVVAGGDGGASKVAVEASSGPSMERLLSISTPSQRRQAREAAKADAQELLKSVMGTTANGASPPTNTQPLPPPAASKPPLHPPPLSSPPQPQPNPQTLPTTSSAFLHAPGPPSSTDEEPHPHAPSSRSSYAASHHEEETTSGNAVPTAPRRTTTTTSRPALHAYTSTGLPVLYRTTTVTERFGSAVPAVAIPRSGQGAPQAVLLYMGVIDFLQPYNARKWLEHMAKATVHDGDSISVVNPVKYSNRFLQFLLGRVFLRPKAAA